MPDDVHYAFESETRAQGWLPLAARRALDRAGEKLSLEGWRSLDDRNQRALAQAGLLDDVPTAIVHAIAASAVPPPRVIEPVEDPIEPPGALRETLGPARPLTEESWRALRALDRYAFRHLLKPSHHDALRALYDERLGAPRLTHLDERGEARMVGVGDKPTTRRRAVASARVRVAPRTLALITAEGTPKGDVFGVARVAAIQAAKRTPELIPLCHGVALSRVEVQFHTPPGSDEIEISAAAEAVDRTGVEMEAMVAASVAALTLYDMLKGIERGITIGPVQLESKEGGRSGLWKRGEP